MKKQSYNLITIWKFLDGLSLHWQDKRTELEEINREFPCGSTRLELRHMAYLIEQVRRTADNVRAELIKLKSEEKEG